MDYQFVTKRIVKRLASPVLDFCGIYDAMLMRRVFAHPSWLILMYHRVVRSVADDPFRLGMCMQRNVFAQQIEYHVNHFTPITVGEAVTRIRTGRPLPQNAVSVTFDDGYLDFKEVALPVLKHYQCPSTIFVTTGGLEQNEIFWWDRVVDAATRTRKKTVDIRFLAPGAPVRELSLASRHFRRSLVLLQNLFWEQPPGALEECVERLRYQLDVTGPQPASAARMRHSDIESIARDDVELGAHCERHLDMRRLAPDERQQEFEGSRRLLQDLTGQPVNGFAYPGGRENRQLQKQVAHAGFTYAAGTVRGLNRQPYDMFSLRRVGMPDDPISDYKRCLASAAGAAASPVRFESIPWP